MTKSNKYRISNIDKLKMMKKVMRETTHTVKPTITVDKKNRKTSSKVENLNKQKTKAMNNIEFAAT